MNDAMTDDPWAVTEPSKSDVLARLRSKSVETLGGCWQDTRRGQPRYPQLRVAGRLQSINRLSAWIHLGLAWEGDTRLVLHHCDNTRCWRPDHLYLGTQADNVRDAVERGRAAGLQRTICKRGHILSAENIYTVPGTRQRRCLVCRRMMDARLKRHRRLLKKYLLAKLKDDDLHGVADAAMDIRDIDAELKGRDAASDLRDIDERIKGLKEACA